MDRTKSVAYFFIRRKQFAPVPRRTISRLGKSRAGQVRVGWAVVFFLRGDRAMIARSGHWRLQLKANHPSMRKRPGISVCFAGVFVIAMAVHPAAARHVSRHTSHAGHESRHGKHASAPAAPYAAIVVDANSGSVLYADKADELRHPASLTKVMTLYLLFEKLDAGKIRLDSPVPVSEHASLQAPTKLGLKPGQSIEVEDAIRGMVTKSANDAAVAVAEAIGGSEGEFADMMTRKAHAMGMSRTIYHNASGLPDDEQVTTARDQALLGRAIQERFPRYYQYFATPSFTYHGQTMRNHNQLLGQVEGIDGIKTGYTQASGFNLVASVRRNNRHIVSVVMGGTSANARDAACAASSRSTLPPPHRRRSWSQGSPARRPGPRIRRKRAPLERELPPARTLREPKAPTATPRKRRRVERGARRLPIRSHQGHMTDRSRGSPRRQLQRPHPAPVPKASRPRSLPLLRPQRRAARFRRQPLRRPGRIPSSRSRSRP